MHAASGSYATLKNIRFEYNQTTKTGVVGSVKLNQVNFTNKGRQPVPNILEKGGTVMIPEIKTGGEWRRRDLRRRRRPDDDRPTRVRRVQIQARPYMEPTLMAEIESGNIMKPWEASIG